MDYKFPLSEYKLPEVEDRVLLHNDSTLDGDELDEQSLSQRTQIIRFAQEIGKIRNLGRYVPVEVWYVSLSRPQESSAADFDAVLVDTLDEAIVETLPPYDLIDPDWKDKR